MTNDNNTTGGDFPLPPSEKIIQLLQLLDSLTGDEKCPKCGEPLPEHPALSRADNQTLICSQCGVKEAMQAATGARRIRRSRIVKTIGASEFPDAFIARCLERHAHQDWGDLDAEDKAANDRAVREGGRVLSAYGLRGDTLWIITEADRSLTTLLTPDEY